MHALHKQHIVDVYVWVDDTIPSVATTGRPSLLRDSELLTILIWDGLTEPHKTLRSLYNWMAREYTDCFPKLPAYQNFVAHTHRLLPTLSWLLQSTLSTEQLLCALPTLPCYRSARTSELTDIR
jgi:hypothetical protein